jgi:hypothetical protein
MIAFILIFAISTSAYSTNHEEDSLRAKIILEELNITITNDSIIQIVHSDNPSNYRTTSTLYRIEWNQIAQLTKDFYNPPPPPKPIEPILVKGIEYWPRQSLEIGGKAGTRRTLVPLQWGNAASGVPLQWGNAASGGPFGGIKSPTQTSQQAPKRSFSLSIHPNIGQGTYFNMDINLSKYSIEDAEMVYKYLLHRIMQHKDI